MRWIFVLFLGALLACTPPLAGAESTGDEPPPLIERLGSPARPEAVAEALAAARPHGAKALTGLVRALGLSGGVGTLPAVDELITHRDREVQRAALEAAERVGLRSSGLVRAVHRALDWGDDDVRCAALAALGHVGAGSDVGFLLDVAASTDSSSGVRRAAFRALRTVSGERKPYRIERWEAWWRSAERRAARSVPRALSLLEEAEDEASRESARGVIRRMGWMKLDLVTAAAERWLRDSDPRLRMEACRIVAGLRLADLAHEVQGALAHAAADDDVGGVQEALRILGVPTG